MEENISQKKGQFITFEGYDGVGKTTQAIKLLDWMKNNNMQAKYLREPGGTTISDKIRVMLSDHGNLDIKTETLLLFASRNELWRKEIKPALDAGIHVICDRFYDSTIVYQGYIYADKIDDIMTLKHMVMGNIEPNHTFLLVCNREHLERRLSSRTFSNRYDEMIIEKYDAMTEGYHKIAEIFAYRVHVINTNKDVEVAHQLILKVLEGQLD